MKRLRTILLFLVLGAILNVAVAWGCALSVNIFNYERQLAIGLSGDTRWGVSCRTSPVAVRVTSSRNPVEPRDGTTELDPSDLVPRWTGYQHPTSEYESGENSIEARIAFGFGWPFVAWWFEDCRGVGIRGGIKVKDQLSWRGRSRLPRILPLYPAWPGVALNTLLYSISLALLSLGPSALRRVIRRKRGLCMKCAYDLKGTDHAACPECGTESGKPGPA